MLHVSYVETVAAVDAVLIVELGLSVLGVLDVLDVLGAVEVSVPSVVDSTVVPKIFTCILVIFLLQ